MKREISGQTQILFAIITGIIVIAAGLFTVENSRQSVQIQSDQTRFSEIREALDQGINFAAHIFQDFAGCDPWIFNEKLNYLNTDGSFRNSVGWPARSLDIVLNSGASRIRRTYTVHFGKIQFLNSTVPPFNGGTPLWQLDYNEVTDFRSQDAMIETWITAANLQMRITQNAILLNVCSTPCSSYQRRPLDDSAYDPAFTRFCQNQNPRNVAGIHDVFSYHWINPALFPPTEPVTANICGSGPSSIFGTTEGGTNISVKDVLRLREFLRGGPQGPMGVNAATLTNYAGLPGTQGCMDLNNDKYTNTIDLNILEKFLRGYIPKIPINL